MASEFRRGSFALGASRGKEQDGGCWLRGMRSHMAYNIISMRYPVYDYWFWASGSAPGQCWARGDRVGMEKGHEVRIIQSRDAENGKA